jgi:integrase/recombinase XerD
MTEQAISPLRRRMIEDMAIRKFAQKTQHDYVRRTKEFVSYPKRSPDPATPEDVRGFQLHLSSIGVGTPKINGATGWRGQPYIPAGGVGFKPSSLRQCQTFTLYG